MRTWMPCHAPLAPICTGRTSCMQPLTLIFLLAVLAGTATRLWLANRQIAAVTRHRDQVPEPFAQTVTAADHSKAADYAVARTRLARIDTVIDAVVLLALTLARVSAS